MYSSYEKLYSIVLDYISDNRYKQAILIDGDWGVGKSHFVTHNLLGKIKEVITANSGNSKRRILYISLYGIASCSEILKEICTQVVAGKLSSISSSDKLEKGISIAAKIASVAMSAFGVESEKLPITDLTNFEDAIIIFDDLERCQMNINEILGFINNLVEHNSIKVIIVANQKEVGKLFLAEDLPQKYAIVLNPRLKIDEKDDSNKPITKDELKKHTELLFANDVLYDKIKEKLIGTTLHFMPDFNLLFDDIIKENVTQKNTNLFVTRKKNIITDMFINASYYNLRTLIFALMNFEKIYSIISELEFDEQCLDKYCESVLKYCVHLAILIKDGGKPYEWKPGAKTNQITQWKEDKSTTIFITGYKFVDNLMLRYELDPQEIKDILSEHIQGQIQLDEQRKLQNELHLKALYTWWELEDSEVYCRLQGVLQDLKDDKYLLVHYKEIIVSLFQMSYHGFKIDKTKYVELMKINAQKMQGNIDPAVLELVSEDEDFIREYNKLMESLISILRDKKSVATSLAINECFDSLDNWGNSFYEYCVKHKDKMISNREFFSTIDLTKLSNSIKLSSLENIYGFLSGIKEVYNFSNLQDFFVSDVESLKEFDNQFIVEAWAKGSINRKIAFDKIKNKLSDVIKILS